MDTIKENVAGVDVQESKPIRHEIVKNDDSPLADVAKVVLGLVNVDNENNKQAGKAAGGSGEEKPHSSREYMKQRERVFSQKEIDTHDTYAQTLFNGGYFIKVGRRGKPKAKFVVCSQEGQLFWNDVTGGKTLTSVKLVNVTEIRVGKNSENFRRGAAKEIPEDLCLSIITSDRSVDLQAETQEIRDRWVRALNFGVKNVQDNGRISRKPITTTELERKEREYSDKIKQLELQLGQTKKVLIVKNQEIIEREQQIVLSRRTSQEKINEKDEVLEESKREIQRLKVQTAELDQKIKRVHHARQASRTVHSRAYQRLEEQFKKLQQEKLAHEDFFQEEKEKFTSMIADSQRLLEKAKETIHKRQLSRAERIAAFDNLEGEAEQLRDRNKRLQEELEKAQVAQRVAIQEIKKVKSLIATDTLLPFTVGDSDDEGSDDEDDVLPERDANTSGDGDSPAIQRTIVMPKNERSSGLQLMFSELKQPEIWQPDDSSDICLGCSNEFTFFNRRHHCRRCGNLVCAPCSKTRVSVLDTGDKVRVCDICIASTSGTF